MNTGLKPTVSAIGNCHPERGQASVSPDIGDDRCVAVICSMGACPLCLERHGQRGLNSHAGFNLGLPGAGDKPPRYSGGSLSATPDLPAALQSLVISGDELAYPPRHDREFGASSVVVGSVLSRGMRHFVGHWSVRSQVSPGRLRCPMAPTFAAVPTQAIPDAST